jgi:hypothetical protein
MADNIEGTPEDHQNLKKGMIPNRLELLRTEFESINSVMAPGIPAIKQVELYSKFRHLVPEEYKDVTCPYPGDDIMGKIKKERKEKAKKQLKIT